MNSRLLKSVIVAGFALAGCTNTESLGAIVPESVELKVYSYWKQAGETDAHEALYKAFMAKNSRVHLLAAQKSEPEYLEWIRKDAADGIPPDVFLVAPGFQLRKFLKNSPPTLLQLDDIVASDSGLAPRIIEGLRGDDGHVYAVPIGLHRHNSIIYMKNLVDFKSPPSVYDVLCQAQDLKNSPGREKSFSPFAVGSGDAWAGIGIVFESFLLAECGQDVHQRLFLRKTVDADIPCLSRVICRLRDYISYSNGGGVNLPWSIVPARLMEGLSAMSIGGEWIKAYLVSGLHVDPASIGVTSIAGPKQENYYLTGTDAFAGVHETKHLDSLRTFFEYLTDPSAQETYNAIKGSIPPSCPQNDGAYDDATRSSIAEFCPGSSTSIVPSSTDINDLAADPVELLAYQDALDGLLKGYVASVAQDQGAWNKDEPLLQSICTEATRGASSGAGLPVDCARMTLDCSSLALIWVQFCCVMVFMRPPAGREGEQEPCAGCEEVGVRSRAG